MPNITSTRRNSTKISLSDSQMKIFTERKTSQHFHNTHKCSQAHGRVHTDTIVILLSNPHLKKPKPNNPYPPPLQILVLTLFSECVFSLRKSQTIWNYLIEYHYNLLYCLFNQGVAKQNPQIWNHKGTLANPNYSNALIKASTGSFVYYFYS